MGSGVDDRPEKDDVIARFYDAIQFTFNDGQSRGKYGRSGCAGVPLEAFEAALWPGCKGDGQLALRVGQNIYRKERARTEMIRSARS